jgi:Predicted membrane protein
MGAMQMSDVQLSDAFRLAITALIGLAVGLEREWSGHADGPQGRFAGLRTFLLLGLIGGSAGLLAREGHEAIAAMIAGGGIAFSIAAYVMAVRQPGVDRDGTTEVAAIIVVALGVLAVTVSWLLAAAAGSLVVAALNEKKRLHRAVTRLPQEELRAGLQFAVLALAVLPFLPSGPFFGWVAFRPRTLWSIVLLFCALNFAGYLARRGAGVRRGYLLTGLLGGVISSTAVTLGFARYSRQYPDASAALAFGAVGACTVLVPRVLIISAVLNRAIAIQLLPFLIPAGLIGAAVVAYGWLKNPPSLSEVPMTPSATAATAGDKTMSWLTGADENPLRLGVAIKLAIIFQVAMIAITFARQTWAVTGLYSTAVVLGLTDVDALTVSMSTPSAQIIAAVAARAIVIGILANTVVKMGISVAVGSPRYRLASGSLLFAMGAAIAVMLVVL